MSALVSGAPTSPVSAFDLLRDRLDACADGRPLPIDTAALPVDLHPLVGAYNRAVQWMLSASPVPRPLSSPTDVGECDEVNKLPTRAAALARLQAFTSAAQAREPAAGDDTAGRERAEEDGGGHLPAAMIIDIDGFRELNEGLGRGAGDVLLRRVGARLQARIRRGSTDLVARVGADDFAIVVAQVRGRDELIGFAQRIVKSLEQEFDIGGRRVRVGCFVGLSIVNDPADDPAAVLDGAQQALRRAKNSPDRLAVHDPSERRRAGRRFALEAKLRDALDAEASGLTGVGDGIRLVFQPIADLTTGRWRALEALARCHIADQVIPPDEFIPLAEKKRLIGQLGMQVLRQSCRAAVELRQRFGADAPIVGVNVSPRQLLYERNLVDDFVTTAAQLGARPQWLKLEITENGILEAATGDNSVLAQAREAGFTLSVDDFGAGTTSLMHFRHDFNEIKIDRGFVTAMTDGDRSATIVRGIIEMARGLGLSVVAEGVETTEQLDMLRQFGCPSGQGYLFSKPLPLDHTMERIAGLLAAGPREAAAQPEVAS
jgi:diguanylate cyclase (GGDEF)-like protein